MKVRLVAVLAALCFVAAAAKAADDMDAIKRELAEMRKKMEASASEVQDLRKKMSAPTATAGSSVDKMLDSKYCGGQAVTTGTGKLTIGGMVQVWYSAVQNDNSGLFDDTNNTGNADENTSRDNDSFRVRRAELAFNMAVHENVTAYIMADLMRGLGNFSPMPTNQGFHAFPVGGGAGGGGASSALQDALINFHGIVPHHDFTVGQFLPTFSEEDYAPNSMLDFVERSFIGNTFPRDVGANIHGSWWDNGGGGAYLGGGDSGRFQYWLTVFNGPGSYFTQPTQNNGDDNDDKDFLATVLVRPLWSDKASGKLELGGSAGFGTHGHGDVNLGTNFGTERNFASRYDAWFKYYFGGVAKGLWLKGEAAYIKDRMPPGSVVDFVNNDVQVAGNPFSLTGGWLAAGYKLEHAFSDCKHSWVKNLEFLVRYEQFDNVLIADPANLNRTNEYHTKVFTPGINYYIKGHNAKLQANYNFVENPDGSTGAKFHNVRNDSFVVNFQVMW